MKEVEVVRHSQMQGLRMFLNTCDYRTPHLHKELELIWVLEGDLEVSTAQEKFFAQQGNLAILNSQQLHALRRMGSSPCTFLCIQVSDAFLAYSYPAIRGLRFDQLVLSSDMEPLEELLDSLMLSYLEREEGYELHCAGMLYTLFYRLLRMLPHHMLSETEVTERSRGEARINRLNRLIDFVEKNHRSKISLSDFAREENRSTSYLSHFVKENLGQSFQEYVTATRFQTACSLIAAGWERLLDVCMESGFSDYRYFSQAFRQRTGMTPEEYRFTHVSRGIFPLQADSGEGSGRSLEHFYSREESCQLFKQLRQVGACQEDPDQGRTE